MPWQYGTQSVAFFGKWTCIGFGTDGVGLIVTGFS